MGRNKHRNPSHNPAKTLENELEKRTKTFEDPRIVIRNKHRNPSHNPAKTLENELEKRTKTFEDPRIVIPKEYYFAANLPNCVDREREHHLSYSKYTPYKDSLATTQEFESLDEAKRHEKAQKSYNPNYLPHPTNLVEYNNMYKLIFDEIMRDFNGGWIHAKEQVSDADMLKILKKIGRNMRYLLTEAESKRPHGNLLKGVDITPELDTLFLNLGRADHANMYKEDIKGLYGFLKDILPTLHKNKSLIQEHVERWIKFLAEACVHPAKEFDPVEASEIHPPYFELNHVRLIVNYPISWEADDVYFFLGKMHKLCMNLYDSLLRNATFESHLVEHYPHWNDCFISKRNTGGLNVVYDAGVHDGNYLDKSTWVLCVPTIVIFAGNCMKHYWDRVNIYNYRNQCPNVTDKYHIDPHLSPGEIIAELEKEFPHLIENIYQAYFKAIASGGYKHPEELKMENVLPRVSRHLRGD